MASIIFISPDYDFTDKLDKKFRSGDSGKSVIANMQDRLSKLSTKEAEIAKREFESALKNSKIGGSKQSIRVEKSLDNLYKNAESLIKNHKIIIVAVKDTRKFFLDKVTPSGVSRDTFLSRLDKVGERNKIKVRKYLLLYSYDIDEVYNKDSFDKLSPNEEKQYIQKTETSPGYTTIVNKKNKSKFLTYNIDEKFNEAELSESDRTGKTQKIKPPAGVLEFNGFEQVIKLEEEEDEEISINDLIRFQKEAIDISKIIFKPTGNMIKDLKIAINNKLIIKVKYSGSRNNEGELAPGIRIVEPVVLGVSKVSRGTPFAVRVWLKKGDTLTPNNRPGWRFLLVSKIDSIEFTGDSFNYKRPSFNSVGDKWMASIIAISSFDKTRVYGKGRRAEIETSQVARLSLLMASPMVTKSQLRKYIGKLRQIKANHESGKQVLGYKDREILYKYFP
jgi:hypothetical protein